MTGPHPVSLLRAKVPRLWRAADLVTARICERVTIGGIVICDQLPGSVKGFTFVRFGDESGVGNAFVTPQLYE